MKKLHLFILKSYLGPLAATFFISLFVLLLQIVWRYIDILVGKGLDAAILSELLFYALLQVIPMALPLAILLASLMAFGNMGENYELTAIKASGISLFKIMRPLIILTAGISLLAFAFADNVMPWANLKFYSRMYSIQAHQPDQEIKEKIFNKLEAYNIKVDYKDRQTGTLHGVMIYDHSNSKNPISNVTIADEGNIKFDKASNAMRLTLHNGVKYEENVKAQKQSLSAKQQQQYRHDKFKKQVSYFNIDNKQLTFADEEGYNSHNKMKNLRQLSHDIKNYQRKQIEITSQIIKHNAITPKITTKHLTPAVQSESPLINLPLSKQAIAITTAKRQVQNKVISLNKSLKQLQSAETKKLMHQIELHRKFTLSFICFIFFFIGSSLGAIIRKGGLGMPVVLAIIFFLIYYLLDTFGANMALKGVIPVHISMWLSSTILLILGVFLTYQSATDSSLLNLEDLKTSIKKRFKREAYDLKNSLDK